MSENIATGGFAAPQTIGTGGIVNPDGQVDDPVNPQSSKGNMFLIADTYVNDTRNSYAVVPIIYKRENTEISTCATPARTVFKYQDRFNITQRKDVRDYIMNVNDIVINNEAVVPEKGDIIIEDTEFQRFCYEVQAFNQEPEWQYSGAFRLAIRIHTKKIDEEDI